MTEIEYKIVVKLMVEKLERLKDEIAEKDAKIEALIARQETLQRHIAEQQEKIIKLEAESTKPIIHNAVLGAEFGEEIKAKAIKEFAESFKNKASKQVLYSFNEMVETIYTMTEEEIDNLVKEMVGDNNASKT